MSAKLSSTAPSPSITNLANKAINRLANSNASSSTNSNHSNSHSNLNIADEDEESGENEEDDEDAGIIRCICNYTDDDGFTIQCERCFVWQHAVCVGIFQSNVPDKYLCELCSPRPVDRKRANEIQRRRIGTPERKREKSPSRRKPNVGRPRKQFGSAGSGIAEQSVISGPSSSTTKEIGALQGTTGNSGTNGYQGKNSSSVVDVNGKKSKSSSGNKQAPQYPQSQNTSTSTSSSHHQSSSKHKSTGQANGSRMSSVTNEDDDFDMESDGQEDALDAYQFEFSPIETNIVTSKAAQDLFRQVIAQFRQAQSRKRSLSLTSGVKLQELVASNAAAAAAAGSSTPSIPESPEMSSTNTFGSQPCSTSSAPPTDPSNVVSMERESLARPLMKTVVKHILPSKSSHSPAPQYGLFAESNIGAGRFMMEFKGEVSLKSAYKADPINQYSILATPKPFVLFHPHLNLVVDARRSGNDARFVRRSCFPNTEVKSIVVPGVQDQTVHLGLFAKVPIGKGQEIMLDWNWNKDHLALQSIKISTEKPKDSAARRSLKEVRKAKHLVASTLLAQTDCACENKETCVLHQMLKDGVSESGTRDHDSTAMTKGSRPKKATADSLRQRYGSQRERSEGKRSADQDTSDEELSVAENSPRRKSPKAFKLENSSKKSKHEGHPQQRPIRVEQDMDSDSESDDHRRRKLTNTERQVSPSKRSTTASQEMSPREMKQALMLIKKMEDRDASSTGNAKQKSTEPSAKDSTASQQKRAGITSPKTRPRDKSRPADAGQRAESPRKKTSNIEDDDISIGDSGIDSDSNNAALRKDPFSLDRTAPINNKRVQTIQSQGKRDREQMEADTFSQSSAASDSDMKDSSSKLSKKVHIQPGKKQPYAAASRGKRMAEHSNADPVSEGHSTTQPLDTLEEVQNLSGASSVEGGFVSIVGNTSDEEEETNHKNGRRILREKNLPKETLPTSSLKPSVLPCKKIWKMIYLKQRALAEEEAREKAEEMRKKAEEVFDLKLEEDEPTIDLNQPMDAIDTFTSTVPLPGTESGSGSKEQSACTISSKTSPPLEYKQPSMIEGDVLNLFRDDVKPETSSTATNHQQENFHEPRAETKSVSRPTPIQQPIIITSVAVAQETPVAVAGPKPVDRPRTPQKLSLETYHAKRLASNSPAPSEDLSEVAPAATAMDISSASKTADIVDVEMSEPCLIQDTPISVSQTLDVAAMRVGEPSETTMGAALTIPKVKLSLQEYQKKRQEASQRVAGTPSFEAPKTSKSEDRNTGTGEDVVGSAAKKTSSNLQTESVDVNADVEMSEEPQAQSKAIVEQESTSRGDYFQVGTSLPTPLIGLSSRAQDASQSSADYFPVQPFSPISLSAGPTPFSKLNLTSSPPRNSSPSDAQLQTIGGSSAAMKSPGKTPVTQRPQFNNTSPKETQAVNSDLKSPAAKLGTSPPTSQGSAGWRTPRSQRGHSPPSAPASMTTGGNYRADHRGLDSRSGDTRLSSPRYFGSPSDRLERPPTGSLNSPTREKQHSLTSGGMPSSPFDGGYSSTNSHYGYNEDSSSFKRPGHLSSPTGPSPPSGPREYYKAEERARHRSMNGDEWSYGGNGGVESPGYGGYRGPRGGLPPPPPRDRDRDRDRDRERDLERDRERERRDRFDRRGDYFGPGAPGGSSGLGSSGNNGGFYGPSRGPNGPGGSGGLGGGGYGRRPGDYYGGQGRDDYSNSGPAVNSNINHGKKEGSSDNAPVSF
ncbi:hypothetical protein BGZ54_006780 [Gamsiella multidivaricata]|nr:hypothetical protein BGZ54_006780 [Gamsiella multidivaricata]